MRALILAAGRGERMRPLTEHTPKALLEVHGKALIEWRLLALRAAGVRSVVINLSWLGTQIRERLGDGRQFGLSIEYSDEGPQPLETAGGMLAALPLLGSAPFVALNADVWTDFDLASLPRQPAGLAHLVLINNPEHHPQGDFALDESGHCRRDRQPRLTFAGIGVYRPELLAELEPGPAPLAPLLFAACAQGKVHGQHHHGNWVDVGTPARLAALNAAAA